MMDEVNSSVEKSTFGDLSVLTALKEQMNDEPDAPAEAKAEKTAAPKKTDAPKNKAAAKKKDEAPAEDA